MRAGNYPAGPSVSRSESRSRTRNLHLVRSVVYVPGNPWRLPWLMRLFGGTTSKCLFAVQFLLDRPGIIAADQSLKVAWSRLVFRATDLVMHQVVVGGTFD